MGTAIAVRRDYSSREPSGRYGAMHFPTAESAAVNNIEIQSKKPSDNTPASDQM
jgi:hypothetical protein